MTGPVADSRRCFLLACLCNEFDQVRPKYLGVDHLARLEVLLEPVRDRLVAANEPNGAIAVGASVDPAGHRRGAIREAKGQRLV